jgi:hypothetical protein
MEVVSAPEIEFCTPPPVGDVDNTTSGASGAFIISGTNLVVTMPGVAETLQTVIHKMTHGNDLKFVILLHAKNANLKVEDLNPSTNEPENRLNIHLVSYDSLTSRGKPSSNDQLSHCTWSLGILLTLIGTRRKIVWAGELR